jgi:hypothetical protein
MRNGTNPIFPIEPFRLKVNRQESVINVENKIQLPVLHQLRDAALPWMEFKMHLVAFVRLLPAQTWQHDCANVVGTRNAEVALLPLRIERSGGD